MGYLWFPRPITALTSTKHLSVMRSAQAAQAWGTIYKTLYESLTRFRKLLGNGPKYKNKDELPYCRCVFMGYGCFWGVSSDF